MDFQHLDQIQTPDCWKQNALGATTPVKKKLRGSKLLFMACLYAVIAVCTVTAFAATPVFYQWLSIQFGSDVQIREFHGYELTESGFFKKQDTVCCLEENGLAPMTSHTVFGSKTYDGQTFDFHFEFCRKDDKIHVNRKSDGVVSVTPYDENHAIIWLNLGKLWNSYFVNLQTGALTPVVDEARFAPTDGILKPATDVSVSDNKEFLLYRSNRDVPDGKGEWFVQNLRTKEEHKLEKASPELFSKDLGFIDDTHIAISFDKSGQPLLYDCRANTYTDFEPIHGSEFGHTLIYFTGHKDGRYTFRDLYANKEYTVKQSDQNRTIVVTRDFIALFSAEGDIDLHLLALDKTIRYQCKSPAIQDIKALDPHTFAITTAEAVYVIQTERN